MMLAPMWNACELTGSLLLGLFRSRASLEAEILVLRQRIIVLRRNAPKRLRFNGFHRLILVWLTKCFLFSVGYFAIPRSGG